MQGERGGGRVIQVSTDLLFPLACLLVPTLDQAVSSPPSFRGRWAFPAITSRLLSTGCTYARQRDPERDGEKANSSLHCGRGVCTVRMAPGDLWLIPQKEARQIQTWKIPGKWLNPETIEWFFCLLTLSETTGILGKTLPLMLCNQKQLWSRCSGIWNYPSPTQSQVGSLALLFNDQKLA